MFEVNCLLLVSGAQCVHKGVLWYQSAQGFQGPKAVQGF